MSYEVFITEDIKEFLASLDEKSSEIIKDGLKKLGDDPYPGTGKGDKEKLPIRGKERYRIHIGRTWTAFYSILEDKKQVRISEILTIDKAHKKYSY